MSCCGDNPSSSSTKVRQCTDVLWLCIFIAFLCLLIFIAAFALVYGNPLLLINGYDNFGNICGTTNEMDGALDLSGLDMTDRSYLFNFDIENVEGSLKICVKQCPTQDLKTMADLQAFFDETGSLLCSYNFNFSMLNDPHFVAPDDEFDRSLTGALGPCPKLPVYASEVVLQRCIPSAKSPVTVDVLSGMYASLNSPAALEQLVSNLYSTWTHILLLTLFAFALSLAMVFLLRVATSVMAWSFMVLSLLSAIAGSGLLWWSYFETKWRLDETPQSQLLEESARNERWLLALAITASVITLVLIGLAMRVVRHISPLVQLFREASHCMKSLPWLMLQPVITVIVLLGLFCVWIYVVLCLATAMLPDARPLFPFQMEQVGNDTTEILDSVVAEKDQFGQPLLANLSVATIKTFTLLEFSVNSWVRYCWWVYLLALVWVSELVLSCQQMASAGAIVNWYFHTARHGTTQGQSANYMGTSIRRLIFYHLGSVVLGSLLITFCKLPRLIMRCISHRLSSDGPCTSCGRTVCRCCLCCYDQGLRVVNHNAYAVIAIEGLDFCPAAQVAYHTMESNALQFATLNSVGDCLLFLGKCAVTAVTGCLGLLWMRDDPQLQLYAVPVLLLCAFSFFVAHAVFTLYEMVLDSLMLCVAEDRALSVSERGLYRSHIVASIISAARSKNHGREHVGHASEILPVFEQQPVRQ